LTDGFIPFQALPHLGVRTPVMLKERLVQVGLWHDTAGGWLVHGYLKHNKAAIDVHRIQDERRTAGASGGKASWQARQDSKQVASAQSQQTLKQTLKEPLNPSTALLCSETATATAPPPLLDVAFRQFQDAYPKARRKGGLLIEQAFLSAVHIAGGVAALMAALENHKASEQWKSPHLVPGMDTWLTEERWRQRFDPPTAVPVKPTRYAGWRPR
jgi:hypothetical protein